MLPLPTSPHLPDFLLCRLCKLRYFVLKSADIVEIYADVLDCVSRPFLVAFMHFNPADKLVENGGAELFFNHSGTETFRDKLLKTILADSSRLSASDGQEPEKTEILR